MHGSGNIVTDVEVVGDVADREGGQEHHAHPPELEPAHEPQRMGDHIFETAEGGGPDGGEFSIGVLHDGLVDDGVEGRDGETCGETGEDVCEDEFISLLLANGGDGLHLGCCVYIRSNSNGVFYHSLHEAILCTHECWGTF